MMIYQLSQFSQGLLVLLFMYGRHGGIVAWQACTESMVDGSSYQAG